jgi:hypothetical protein
MSPATTGTGLTDTIVYSCLGVAVPASVPMSFVAAARMFRVPRLAAARSAMESGEVTQRRASTPGTGAASHAARVDRTAAAAGEPDGTERRERISGILAEANGMASALARGRAAPVPASVKWSVILEPGCRSLLRKNAVATESSWCRAEAAMAATCRLV